MKRQHPFFTLFGTIATVLLLAGLGLMLWVRGGEAFSPGELSSRTRPGQVIQGFASHAEFEAECRLCHQPLQTTQDQLCLDCHSRVREQIAVRNGSHGHIDGVERCAECHSDHRGDGFDLLEDAFVRFDHSRTHFSLDWHQVNYNAAPMDCAACHQVEGDFSPSDPACTTCHAGQDMTFVLQHMKDFGEGCTACHDGRDRMVNFDHQQTEFPLEGRHALTACAACHGLEIQVGARGGGGSRISANLFRETPLDCQGCHAEPQAHLGMFSVQCADCHSPESWSPAVLEGRPFEHAANSGFSLRRHQHNFLGQAMVCQDCHAQGLEEFDVQACIACHSPDAERTQFMVRHQEQYGQDCIQCHDGLDRMVGFDHAAVFVLDGRHAEIECTECHSGQKFSDTPRQCVECHSEPDLHAGVFGLGCQNCHSDRAWAPARLRIHTFLLDHGGQGDLECTVCHAQSYTEYTCFSCHDHQPAAIAQSHADAGILETELVNCAGCHPTGVEGEAGR